jgi:hypothetical protein
MRPAQKHSSGSNNVNLRMRRASWRDSTAQAREWAQNFLRLNISWRPSPGNILTTVMLKTMVLITLRPRITTAFWTVVTVRGIP